MNGSTDKNRERLLSAGISSRNAQEYQAISVLRSYDCVASNVIEHPFQADPISGRRLLRVPFTCERHNLPLHDFDCPACIDEARARMRDALRLMGYQEAA